MSTHKTELYYYDGVGFQRLIPLEELVGVTPDYSKVKAIFNFYSEGDNKFLPLTTLDMVKDTCDYDISNIPHFYNYFDGATNQILLTEAMNLTSGYKIHQKVIVEISEGININFKQYLLFV